MEFVDQLNRIVNLPKTPQRIISLVPSQTELLVDLGLRNSIVGITKFCVHPADLKSEKAIVGGTKNVNFNKIKSLQPDIIICNKEENTEEMVKVLENIAPVWISDIVNIPQSIEMIEKLGEIFERILETSEISLQIKKEQEIHKNFIQKFSSRKVLYLIWKNPYMAAGRATFINSLLKENNFENVFSDESNRYPEVTLADFERANLILLSTEPYPFKDSDVLALRKKFKVEVKIVDGEFFSWYGSRLIGAFKYFQRLH